MKNLAARTSYRRISYCVISAALTLAPHVVLADPPSRALGLQLAQKYCAECHVVVPRSKGGWTDAPTFEAIANRQGSTAQTLSAFIQQEHMHMVNTGRPPGEANAIAAYILSLRKS
jgi:mono/diheme cytochrome c family protein